MIDNMENRQGHLFRFIFHCSLVVLYLYSIHWLVIYGLDVIDLLHFFSFWTIVIHLVMNISLAIYYAFLLAHVRFSPVMASIWYLLINLAIILSCFTQIMFWVSNFYGRDMAMPFEAHFPPLLSHMLHTMPLFFGFVSFWLFKKSIGNIEFHFDSLKSAIIATNIFVIVQLSCTLIIFEWKGFWPYVFMLSFSEIEFMGFSFVLLVIVNVIAYNWMRFGERVFKK